MEITLEDYLRDNPDKTEEDFAKLKALSDEIYYQKGWKIRLSLRRPLLMRN